MRAGLTTGKDRGVAGLYSYDLYVRVVGFQTFADTADGTARTHTGNEYIDFAVRIAPDFLCRCLYVHGRVCRVLELLQDNRARCFIAQGFRFGDRTFHAVGSGGQDEVGAECFQQITAFQAHGFRHGQYQFISFGGRDEGQSDAGISAGGLDDGGSRFQDPFFFGIFDHCQGDAVFHTACRVEVFQFSDQFSF